MTYLFLFLPEAASLRTAPPTRSRACAVSFQEKRRGCVSWAQLEFGEFLFRVFSPCVCDKHSQRRRPNAGTATRPSPSLICAIGQETGPTRPWAPTHNRGSASAPETCVNVQLRQDLYPSTKKGRTGDIDYETGVRARCVQVRRDAGQLPMVSHWPSDHTLHPYNVLYNVN